MCKLPVFCPSLHLIVVMSTFLQEYSHLMKLAQQSFVMLNSSILLSPYLNFPGTYWGHAVAITPYLHIHSSASDSPEVISIRPGPHSWGHRQTPVIAP